MCWIADDGLVQVSDFDFDLAFCVRYRAEVSNVAVTADPDSRPFRQASSFERVQPLVELQGIASNVGLRRHRHFKVAALIQHVLTLERPEIRRSRAVCFSQGSSAHLGTRGAMELKIAAIGHSLELYPRPPLSRRSEE